MKIIHGAAFGTGGGCIAVIGETDNGLWFIGDNWGGNVIKFDVRKTCGEMNGDEWKYTDDDDLAAFYIDFNEDKYVVDVDEKEWANMYRDFCVRYDCREREITKGFEKYDSHINNLCDYIWWSNLKVDEYSKPIHFKNIISNKLNEDVDHILSDVQNRVEIKSDKNTSAKLEKAKETLVDEIIKLLESDFKEV